ncbi:response regulator [Halobacillus sp. ACCC02827]|uniref:response regulator n=1 Tax=Bacillaceae TaxID=186817 RepID=UPI000426B2CD|nr:MULTISPECIES: response regulator [Bacillaceae]QHT47776.1 response regulator [Bacillus sp. SB49]WJE15018.1 response regulator [Halobacillus sp. ACCC02827]
MKVMVSEDDFRVADMHAQFLQSMPGITVVGKALNASETLVLLEEKRPDLLLLDVYMPDRLGVEILHEIRETALEVDIIMITAAKEKEVVEQALKYGVVDYIIKPITLERFQQTIEDYRRRRTLLKNADSFDQAGIDRLLKASTLIEAEEPIHVPKGIDPRTLKKVEGLLRDSADGLTAEQASNEMGASKTTARRYLEYLISIRKGKAEMNYGRVGRPERKYYSNK